MPQTWFVTGASAGFGRILTEELLGRGHRVAATARRPETLADLVARYPETCVALPLDVTVPAQITAAVEAAESRLGPIDVLVNNAGYGTIGAVEEVSDAELRAMFEVNVFGLVDVTKAVLPGMRARRSGHILMLSSTAGICVFPGSSTYSATKHAVEALSEGLALELAPLGVRVTLIEPGPFRTEFAGRSIVLAEQQIADYDETAGTRRAGIKAFDGTQAGDPVAGVRAMIAVTEMPEPPLRLALGNMAYDMIRQKLAKIAADLDAGEALGRPTDYPGQG